jgi:hypothetical protein
MFEAVSGATSFAVQRGTWSDPAIAAMVAPPVVVSSMPIGRAMNPWRRGQLERSRGNMPVGKHRGSTR